MRLKALPWVGLTALVGFIFFANGCGVNELSQKSGTDTPGGSTVIIGAIQVPGANKTVPFAIYDVSWVDPGTRRDYVANRSQAAVNVYDTKSDTQQLADKNGGVLSPGVAVAAGSPCDPSVTHPDCPGGVFMVGFTGTVCCTSAGKNFNPLSGPDGIVVTPDGKLLFAGNGDSTVEIVDLTTNPPTVRGIAQTGVPFTPPTGNCVDLGTGCGDFRADEMAFDPTDHILVVANGDPAVPFLTFIDATKPTCVNNSCVLGQMFFDGAGGTSCPNGTGVLGAIETGNPSFATFSTVPCSHGPIAMGGIGGSAFNPPTGRFLISNTQDDGNPADGEVTVINPLGGSGAGVVVSTVVPGVPGPFSLAGLGCQVASVVVGPSQHVLVGCENHDGVTFPPNTFIIDGTSGKLLASLPQIGGEDETWFNPGDNRFYTASRDMPSGAVLGVIDAVGNVWLQNSPATGGTHSVAADPINNHIYVPSNVGGNCGQFSGLGCIVVYAAQ